MRKILAALAAAVLTACGGGGSDAPDTTPSQPVQTRTNLLVLGNSLAVLPVDATYVPGSNAWGPGGWGMAASEPAKDYAHTMARLLGNLPVMAMNLAANERDPNAPLPAFTVGSGTVVVIQLGDNGLAARYGELVDRARGAARLICMSSWGYSTLLRERDAVMRQTCTAAGGVWVDISDLYTDASNVGVLGHPNDTGMSRIAERGVAAAR